jgi:hypothetical protein
LTCSMPYFQCMEDMKKYEVLLPSNPLHSLAWIFFHMILIILGPWSILNSSLLDATNQKLRLSENPYI